MKKMVRCSLILSIVFLGGAFSNLIHEEPEEQLFGTDDPNLTSFFGNWIPRMRMRDHLGRRSVDEKASDLKQDKINNDKRFWNGNQKDMMSFLDNYRQGNVGKEKRLWNANQKDMMSFLDTYKQGGAGKDKRFWRATPRDMISFLKAYKQGSRESV